MVSTSLPEPNAFEQALDECKEHFEAVFDSAPVMMHSIDQDGRITKVNQRWLEVMGYEADGVLDKKSIDFLTDECRLRAVQETLPLFWKSGSARSVGYRFVPKNGQALDLLLDAEAIQVTAGNKLTYAVLYDWHDHIQWELASSTIRVLKTLANLQQQLTHIPSEVNNDGTDPNFPRTSDSSEPSPEIDAIGAAQGQIIESARIAAISLQALARVHEELVAGAAEQQRDLLLVARTFDKILAEIAGKPSPST